MNAFQSACRDTLDAAFARAGLEPHHQLLDYDETGAADAAMSRYLRTQAIHRGRLYDLYAYDDEAGAHIENNWYLFEKQHFDDQDALIFAVGEFTRGCLGGASPVDAFRAATKRRSAP